MIGIELEVLRDVVGRLERAGFEYMLTGSLASSYYATPRMTRDIDLVVALDADVLPRLRATFEPDYYVPADVERAFIEPGMFNVVHLASVMKVDLIVRKDDAYRRVEFGRRRRVDLAEFGLWIVSREDLVLSKLAWALDSGSEQQRRDVRGLLAADLDWAYLSEWAGRLGVAALLDSLRHA
jgi:hypothetical protein